MEGGIWTGLIWLWIEHSNKVWVPQSIDNVMTSLECINSYGPYTMEEATEMNTFDVRPLHSTFKILFLMLTTITANIFTFNDYGIILTFNEYGMNTASSSVL
jgi:hypothetical protein